MRVDLLHLLRSLRRSPGGAIAAALTLMLTTGAGASIFALVDVVLLPPLPFASPDALVTLGEIPLADAASSPRVVTYTTFENWRLSAGSIATLEAFDGTNFTLTELGPPERLTGMDVTPGFLNLLGVRPALGRTFEMKDTATPVAIVSDAFWRRKLAADPAILGRQIILGSRPHTIVGVLPERFTFALNPCDVWRPFQVAPAQAKRAGDRVGVLARLAPRVTARDVERVIDRISRSSSPSSRAVATPVAAAIAGGASEILLLLGGAAGLSLFLAIANLVGLLIVRSMDRRRELAVRSALGAPQGEIARQLLLEAGVIVTVGTVAGVLLASWLTPLAGRMALQQIAGIGDRDLGMSWRVIVFVTCIAAACVCACGLVLATIATRLNAADVLRRGLTPHPRERVLRRVFVAAEIALAFVLLVSMTLLGRSLLTLVRVNPGFDPAGLVVMNVSVPRASYDAARVTAFYSAVHSALDQRFGPHSTALVDEIPLSGSRRPGLVSAGRTDVAQAAIIRAAGESYFEVMRIPLLAGRAFDERDNMSAPSRAILSRALAQRLFDSDRPIGREIWLPEMARAAQVVAVVGDVKHHALDESVLPTLYLSALQSPSHSSVLIVRSERPKADVASTVREEISRLDGNVPVYAEATMEEIVARSPGVQPRRVATTAFTAFALLAVTLGALGLFGITAYEVTSRRAELALRIALGADPCRILFATIAQGAAVAVSGLTAGVVLSIWSSRALSGVLPVTGHLDMVSMIAPTAAVVIAATAAIIPAAWRAARIDPLTTLRTD
jgi:predicted permease